jgi:hypothetical protein
MMEMILAQHQLMCDQLSTTNSKADEMEMRHEMARRDIVSFLHSTDIKKEGHLTLVRFTEWSNSHQNVFDSFELLQVTTRKLLMTDAFWLLQLHHRQRAPEFMNANHLYVVLQTTYEESRGDDSEHGKDMAGHAAAHHTQVSYMKEGNHFHHNSGDRDRDRDNSTSVGHKKQASPSSHGNHNNPMHHNHNQHHNDDGYHNHGGNETQVHVYNHVNHHHHVKHTVPHNNHVHPNSYVVHSQVNEAHHANNTPAHAHDHHKYQHDNHSNQENHANQHTHTTHDNQHDHMNHSHDNQHDHHNINQHTGHHEIHGSPDKHVSPHNHNGDSGSDSRGVHNHANHHSDHGIRRLSNPKVNDFSWL